MYYLLCIWVCKKPKSQTKHYNPRFTAVFTNRINDSDDAFVSDADEQAGWDIIPDPRPGDMQGKAWVRHWTSAGTSRGVPHKKGDLMLTWHVRGRLPSHTPMLVSPPVLAARTVSLVLCVTLHRYIVHLLSSLYR